MKLIILIFVLFHLASKSFASDFYPSYKLSYDPLKGLEWSNDRALSYILTLRLFDYDHHVFQYRRYPCQYFYTDEIQLNYNNETTNECIYNTTTNDYEYSFQLHLDSRHIEPYILRNIAIQCKYLNCSLSLLNMKYIRIGWNLRGRDSNLNCSFDTSQQYAVHHTPYKLTEWITLRCKSLSTCQKSKYNLEQALTSYINIIYGSSYELDTPYCSLEKSLAYVMEKNFAETNRLLGKLVELLERGFGRPDEREQTHMKEYVEQKWMHPQDALITNTTALAGEVQGTFNKPKER
ncbi:unnamed protein product [Adineta ricciae]|uniref:Uncharacterized protein n=1 Tax=Adineta ricciae TaxID=249248 RepID=A0A814RJJ5_ADIRI|nr:unnamed protein product [Adineta ricciae]CAF1624146.1 unnamed protein product [Adineta ricciae]